jgi:hypothetical protein
LAGRASRCLPTFISSCGFGFMRTRAPINFFVESNSSDLLAMPKTPQKPAPTGKWEMPNSELTHRLGQFVMAWSLIEANIEIGIGKELGTAPLETSIVTAGLMFRARSSILMSLLNRDPTKNAEPLRLLKEIVNLEDRNDFMHSVIGGSADLLWFNRRKTKERFTSKIENYPIVRMTSTLLHCTELSVKLGKALHITKEDYLKFFQDSHDAANSISG